MKVKVLYFAAARDIAGTSTEEVRLGEGETVEGLSELVMRRHPGFKKMERSVRYSVNAEVVRERQGLKDGDVVGVLPPVAGG